MWNRVGKDAIGRATNSERRATIGRRPVIENLEGRQLMTAAIAPIANVVVPQFQGYQVPVIGGTTHQQVFAVTSDNPGVKATVTQGRFLTIGVSHTAASATDVTVNGTMTFQLFNDLTPVTAATIESLVNGTATNLAPNVSIGSNYYAGRNFHRISPGFPDASTYIVQGGSLDGNGGGSVFATPYIDEFNQSVAFTGTGQIALANSGADTNDSQFFITTGSPTSLSYRHTIFGQIVAGQDILAQLTRVTVGGAGNTTPTSPVTIVSAAISDVNPSGVIHLDTTVAAANSAANVTVTATDVTDNTTATETFQVNVSPVNTADPQRPFVGPYDQSLSIAQGQTARFRIFPVSVTPGNPLTFTVQGGVTRPATTNANTFIPVDNTRLTASVDATGLVSVTPVAGATGPATLLIGVRDNTNRAGTGAAADAPDNYEFHLIRVNLLGTATPVAQRPLSAQATISAIPGGSTPIQLSGTNLNATTTLPLTYTITTPPTNGTITAFDPTTGTLTYTPTAGYAGPDAIAYRVVDPNSNLSSFDTTVRINVTNATTGAVRFIANDGTSAITSPGTLIVTPNPRTDGGTNTITASVVNGIVQIAVNGVVDVIQPTSTNLDRIVIYGSKANDNITIDPTLSTIATIDGGRGGRNVLTAGAGQTRAHGWYGSNTLVQGSSDNYQLGRTGRVRFVKGTGSSNVIFVGEPGYFRRHLNRNRQLPTPTTGTYYRFAGNGRTLVEVANPYNALNRQERAARTADRRLRNSTGSNNAGGNDGTDGTVTDGNGSATNGGTSTVASASLTPRSTKATARQANKKV